MPVLEGCALDVTRQKIMMWCSGWQTDESESMHLIPTTTDLQLMGVFICRKHVGVSSSNHSHTVAARCTFAESTFSKKLTLNMLILAFVLGNMFGNSVIHISNIW